jgi:hypothetical protein
MKASVWSVFTGLCGLAVFALCAVPSSAQATEVKEKPPMYSYVANWQIPREHWGDMAKVASAESPIFDKAVADGTLVGYGNDVNLVHTPDGETHDAWWSATSLAGLMKVLDQLRAADISSSPYSLNPTKHWDNIYVSRYYNWKSGSYTGGYVSVAMYKLKANAPDDAVETLSKNMFVPLLEKLLADGTILEYEVDFEAVHTDAPDTFAIVTVAPQPEGLDALRVAIRQSMRDNPLAGPAFDSAVDYSAHRDELLKGNGTFK